MADPWRRLCAQLLDALIVLPATIGLIIVAVWMVWSNSAQKTFATVVWLELAVALAVLASYVVLAIYEAITTARWGRSPGKAVMDIRPVCVDGSELGWGRSFGRAFAYSLARLLSVLWLLDVLWCLWDENSQCLHDKVCDTIVVND